MPAAQDLIDELRDAGIPRRSSTKLQRNKLSLRMALLKDAWKDADRTLDDPGEVTQLYYEELNAVLVVFDSDDI